MRTQRGSGGPRRHNWHVVRDLQPQTKARLRAAIPGKTWLTYDESIRTVAVPVFNNSTFEAGLDAQLTEAIIKEIQRTTKWTVVSTGTSRTEEQPSPARRSHCVPGSAMPGG